MASVHIPLIRPEGLLDDLRVRCTDMWLVIGIETASKCYALLFVNPTAALMCPIVSAKAFHSFLFFSMG